jgi:hypothetical protein
MKRRYWGAIGTFITLPLAAWTMYNSIHNSILANSEFPPIEKYWDIAIDWTFPAGICTGALIWSLIVLLATDKYWDWLMRSEQ